MEREIRHLGNGLNVLTVQIWQDPTSLTSSTFLTSGREFLMNVILPILKS